MTIEDKFIWSAAPFAFFGAEALVSDVIARSDIEKHHYVVVKFPDGSYVAIQKVDLTALSDTLNQLGKESMLDDVVLGELLEPYAHAPVRKSDEFEAARDIAASQLTGYAVVVDDQGGFLGLLSGKAKRISSKADSTIVNKLVNRVAVQTRSAAAPSPETTSFSGSEPSGPGVLSIDDETDGGDKERFINVEVRDRRSQPINARKQPLEKDQTYQLAVDIDVEARETAITASAAAIESEFREGEEEIELTVRVISDDFKVRPDEGKLFVPRTGKSLNEVTFFIQPLHDGQGVINIIFLRDGNFIQAMTIKLMVGELLVVESQGRNLEQAFSIPRRDLNLTILNMGSNFHMVMTGPVAATASLPLKDAQLEQMISGIRKVLLETVNLEVGPNKTPVFQRGIDIPENVSRAATLRLAQEGYRLYDRIFFGEATDDQTKKMGEKLREALRKEKLNIQIFAQEFMMPWGVLYLSDKKPKTEDEVDPEFFLGLRHVIEHIPLQQDMAVLASDIDAREGLSVGLNVNTDIDKDWNVTFIKDQVDYWNGVQQRGDARVAVRQTRDDLLTALEETDDTPDQLMYFNCHAVSRNLAENEGPESSKLQMSGKQNITLGELRDDAGYRFKLPGNPLVFINACQSAELSPLFYGGFVPYFMSKGARGVIGTECDTPAIFGKEFALRFFDRFLKGEALGEIMYNLRREFFFNHNNIMGLLYAVYVDGDTRLVRE